MPKLTRRNFLTTSAAVVGGAAATTVLSSAAADGSTPSASAAAAAAGRTGTVKDVKHVVVLMQENRSFDHYYGAMAGVRGFADKQAQRFPDGSSILAQPSSTRTAGVLMPYRMDTTIYNAQQASDLPHDWDTTHSASNSGAWNRWVGAKGEETMGHFTRSDIPYQYALADAFTICDSYHCSLLGPTTPNRLYLWTGMVDPSGTSGGPAISNPDDYNPVYKWKTYPERLQEAGVDWQVYANDEVGDSGSAPFLGDYGDNPLWLFQAYHDALASSDPKVRQLADRANVHGDWKPDSGQGKNLDHVLSDFIAACDGGTLPTVSWVVAPYGYSEHPEGRPVDGAAYTNRVLQALWDNPTLWASTVVIVDFDENDGFFDHALPPFAPAGTAAEYVGSKPLGMGPRVPLLAISPWSRGGWVNSQLFDHTSVLRFLEVVTGVKETNISAWRRSVCGDLTSCFDFTTFDPSIPKLPDVTALVAQADAEESLPMAPVPPNSPQAAPTQENGVKKQRHLPYQPDTALVVDRKSGRLTATVTNAGKSAMAMSVYPAVKLPFAATPLLAPAAGSTTYLWEGAKTDGVYDFTIHGANGFLRRFAGTVVRAGQTDVGVPEVHATVMPGTTPTLSLTLGNSGHRQVRFTCAANDFGAPTQTAFVDFGKTSKISWPTSGGWYDVTVTANTGTGFSYRFAGRVES